MIEKKNYVKNFLAIVICFVIGATIFAQDKILLKNGNEIQSVVQEVGFNEIKYKRFDNLNGPTYIVKKIEINQIVYENGTMDFFGPTSPSEQTDTQQEIILNKVESVLYYSRGVCQNELKLKPEYVRAIMFDNRPAFRRYNFGRTLYVTGQIIAYPSALIFLLDLGFNDYSDGTALTIGALGTAGGLIMFLCGKQMIKNSIQLYNFQTKNSTTCVIDFCFDSAGLKLSLNF